ncbi:MAG TPA: TrmH family RNA methyltransferase, partial [Bacteroidales bacterium]|nr:TrmH family RNA methyltransferase [Bacteroidales bacterium]
MFEKISSVQNPKVKNVLHLGKASERKEQNLFVAEGYREIHLAFEAGYEFNSLFYCPEISNNNEVRDLVKQLTSKTTIFEITVPIFEKIAYRENSDGLVALVVPRYLKLNELKLSSNPLIVVLEKVEKPGNLGAVLRTADAARVDAVLVCDPLTDIFNPNVIRSSIGCVFTNKVVCCTSAEAIAWLRKAGIKSYATALTATKWYHETSLTGPSAIVMGTEADGLSDFWLNESDMQVKIPMLGYIDSLN